MSHKEPIYQCRDARDLGSIPGLGRSPGGGHSNSCLENSCLENPTDRGAWWAIVYRVAKSVTQLKWLSTHARILGRDPGKLSNLAKRPKPSFEIPSSAKDKRGCWGSGLGLQRRERLIHRDMEKQMFAEPARDNRTQSGLWSPDPARVPHHTWSTFFTDTSGDHSILGTSPLSKFFGQPRGR